mgnify:CR=1 FL=1
MNMMELKNMKVIHNTFGEGTVVSVDGNQVHIDFGNYGIKDFVYPDIFATYVKLQDPAVQVVIDKEIIAVKIAKERAEAMLEEKRKMEKALAENEKRAMDVDSGFGPDYHVEHLTRQPILTYKQVEDKFNIKILGPGKGINRTDSAVVLISSVDKKKSGFLYHDHWDINGDYIYSGEGKYGDQKMTDGNKAIKESESDGKMIQLFVKLSSEEYYYQGVFKFIEYYYEDEVDEAGNNRKEYKFRLRKV